MPAEYYGGTFRIGDYPGLPNFPGGYRGPSDSQGYFHAYPTDCGSWVLDSIKLTGAGALYIREDLGGGCLERNGATVRIYLNNLPPLGTLWETVTIDIEPGDCPAGDGDAEGENPLP
jgi:hypothetical protein